MIDYEDVINKLKAFYDVYPRLQSKLIDYENRIRHLEIARLRKLEEEKYDKAIIKQFMGKIKRIEQFLIENGLIRLLGKKVTVDEVKTKKNDELKDLSTKIHDLSLSVRVVNILHAENIFYLDDLVKLKEYDLMRFPNLGTKSIKEIKLLLSTLGLTLKQGKINE